MATIASVYFLSCCRPTYGSSFCYYVEHTKFVNSNFYTNKSQKKAGCPVHGPLHDHSLNQPNSCTDYRAWSNDEEQQRSHFLEVSSGQRCLCGSGPVEDTPAKRKEEEPRKEKEETPKTPVAVVAPSSTKIEVKKETKKEDEITKSKELIVHKEDEAPLQSAPEASRSEDRDDLGDDMRKLDCNLSALEETFYKFICKNRCLIQNLGQCLNFEKQKQKELQSDYCKLRHENDVLRTKNEYLNMVNNKQIELFKNELHRAICENKCMYSRKIQELQSEIQLFQEELQSYKKNEVRILDAVECEKKEKTKLKCDVKSLKGKEVKLLKNYVKLLNFIGEVKKTLTTCNGNNRGNSFQMSSNTNSGCDTSFELKGVLKNALNNGIESLNVRDLSILHDAVQGVNQRLCHQNDSCGINPISNLTVSHLSMMYTSTEHCEEFPSAESFQNQFPENCFQGYETSSNLSLYPSRQKPGDKYRSHC